MPQPITSPTTAPRSDLLAALRPADRALIEHRCSECELGAGEVIYRRGDDVEYCYFPNGSAMCSFFVELDCGAVVETIPIGREGALGGVVSQGMLPAYACAKVLHQGRFQRIAAGDLEEAKRGSPTIANLFARYADCMMAQVFQSIACNAVHTIEQRAAKWLGLAVDRIGRNDVTMTQEQLASIMGIGRSYASRVLQRFKHDGLVRTRRGRIEVLDREALHRRACTCNDRVSAHFHKVLGGVYSAEP
ncbi:cAMP-binding domain of CRP or a regulatory subunit of cAMP-dependent protein kinases [Novosphingobium sp. CF614]|uniref:Crp/Fnr family transcriptional regulator n=1 Tax=Novosphingobium sp. CF614 TaxID=1884364 RepID=UPI0008E08456|nr:Crp/Fnr family transcriptional regulator [Novosphingobium sp. CF614]SFG10977.1 cAMP-binding domain of CRP or a regulatory subunit of cAMP-dependent protein kinases [Novosphingobium sp. CF614]